MTAPTADGAGVDEATVRAAEQAERLLGAMAQAVLASGRPQVLLARDAGLSEKHVSQMLTGKADGSLTAWFRLLIAAGHDDWAAGLLSAGEAVPLDREALGRLVREVWMEWAREQPDPKPSWLVPWEGLSEPDREVDRRIGEAVARRALAGEAVPQSGALTDELGVIAPRCPDCGWRADARPDDEAGRLSARAEVAAHIAGHRAARAAAATETAPCLHPHPEHRAIKCMKPVGHDEHGDLSEHDRTWATEPARAEGTLRELTTAVLAVLPQCTGCFADDHPCGRPECDVARGVRAAFRAVLADHTEDAT